MSGIDVGVEADGDVADVGIRFRVLGPIEAVVDGTVVPSGGAKQLALLGRLLLSPGRIVSVDQLTEAIWDAVPPARPEASIRSSVSKWRTALSLAGGGERSILVTNSPGYRLDVLAGQVDALRFEQHIHEARDLLRRDPDAAESVLASALGEWRGDAYSGCSAAVFASARARLVELRSTAQDLRIEALIDAGNVRLAIADLELLLAADDIRESRHGLAMRALYLDGRQADSLAVYQRLRERLIENFGVEPSQPIADLEQQILTQDSSLTPRSAALVVPAAEVRNPALPTKAIDPPPPGRAVEADVIAGAFAQLAAGSGSTILLTGEPGIGKTTLARYAAATKPFGSTAAWGRCIHGGAATVLGPWSQVLRDLCEGHSQDQIMSWVGSSAELGQLYPALARDTEARPSDDRLDLFDSVMRFLRRRSAVSPLVLLFEDVHWADSATVELISFAAQALADDPVSFVVTWRDTDLDLAPVPAIQELGRVPRCSRVELAGIATDVIEGLLTDSMEAKGSTPDADVDAVAAAMYERTEGNPLFVVELLGLISEDATLASAAGVRAMPPTTGIQDAIRRRVESVGTNAVDVLSVLAVVDEFASLDLIEKVCSPMGTIDRRTIEDVVSGAHRAGLVVEDPEDPGSLRLHHALVVDTLADDLLGFRSAKIHADVGQALWEEGATSAVLAHHFTEGATAGTGALAASFSLEAAAAAGSLYDLPRAYELLERGLVALRCNKPTDLVLECDLLVAMSQIHKQSGDYQLVHETASAAFEAAKDLGDLPRMVAAATSYAERSAEGAVFERVEWLGYWHPSEPAVEMLEFCIGKLPTDHPSLVNLFALLGSARYGAVEDVERARRELISAVELGRDIGSPHLLRALSVRIEVEACYGTPETVDQIVQEILAYAPTHRSVHDLVQAHRVQAILAADRGSEEEMLNHVGMAVSEADAYDNDLARLQAMWTQTAWTLYRGDLPKAEEAIVSGMTTFARFGVAAIDALGLQYAGLRRDQGQLAEVEELLRFKLSSYDGPAFRAPLAMSIAEQGRFDEARDLIDAELGGNFASLGEPALQYQTPACWAVAVFLTGHREAAELLYPVFAEQPSRLVSLNHGMLHFGSTPYFAGMLALTLGDLAGANHHLDDAESFERSIGARTGLLRVLAVKRTLLDRMNLPAQEVETEALALASSLGMEWVLEAYQ